MSRYMVGCDIGGTFTDVICIEQDSGELRTAKVLSTPPMFIDGVINGLNKAGIAPEEMAVFRHGSTISTNTIVQRRGAKTGVLTTEGFRDVLIAGRAEREETFDLNWDFPLPLVPRRHILTARERINYEGEVVIPLNEEDVQTAARKFRKRGMEAIAICFIDSFMNPAHERRAKEIIAAECPGAYICTSYEILPEMREFERTSTTMSNAYIGPIMKRYLADLKRALNRWGYPGEILITHSGGGVMASERAEQIPIWVSHSSPVSGVMGIGRYVGELAGFDNIITFEMGGTTNDVSIIYKGEPIITHEWKILWNVPVLFPAVDTTYIGAGGGSIAWIDSGGMLRSGPQSAGANPGPVCFGFGGTEPTTTDAHLVLGRLSPDNFLGGEMKVSLERSHEAIKTKIADFYHWSVEEAADGILQIANVNMVNAVRLMTVEKGYDPRDFVLIAYGGAGPMHAVEAARDLSVPTVIIPPLPGYASAFGATRVDVRHDLMRPIHKTEREVDLRAVNRAYEELYQESVSLLSKHGIGQDQMVIQYLVDVKYYDQSAYLTVPVSRVPLQDLNEIINNFLTTMKQRYGYTLPPGFIEVEVVNLRVTALGLIPKPEIKRHTKKGTAKAGMKGERRVFFREAGGYTTATIYDRQRLPYGATIQGPAIVEQQDSTTVIPPKASAKVDQYLNLIIKTH